MHGYAILSGDLLTLTSNSLPFLHIGNYYFYNLSHLLVSMLVIYSSPGGFQPVLRNLLFGQRGIFLCEDGEKRSQVLCWRARGGAACCGVWIALAMRSLH